MTTTAFFLLLRAVRSRFAVEHVDAALALIDRAPHAGQHVKRFAAAAYRRGLLDGLATDSTNPEPVNPYRRHSLPNFARGENDPVRAWLDGAGDGLRVQTIINRPERAGLLTPPLTWREAKACPNDVKERLDVAVGPGR